MGAMKKLNITQFATELGLPVALLLEQLKAAGIAKEQESDPMSEKDKAKLLEHLRQTHGAEKPAKKITLIRRETTEIKKADSAGRARTIQAVVRERRVVAPVAGAEAVAVPVEASASAEVAPGKGVTAKVVNEQHLATREQEARLHEELAARQAAEAQIKLERNKRKVCDASKEVVTPVKHKRQSRVDGYFSKAKKLLPEHPAASLNNMRKAVEAICKDILEETYEKKGEGKTLKPASAFTSLEDMTQELKRRKQIPLDIEKYLASLQLFGNFGSHDQELDPEDISSEKAESIMAESMLLQLNAVVDWYKAFDLSAQQA